MPVCAVCSGTDFFCDSGYYYCTECQTQSQDIREELHEEDGGDEAKPIGGKRKRSRSSILPKSPRLIEENMTSWEGYNFALVGLVNELTSLGVNPEFKKVVLQLWTTYLAKIEVAFTSKTEPAIPKLGPNYKHYDAEIIYGYSERKAKKQEERKKKKKKRNDGDDEDLLDNSTDDCDLALRKKNLKRKRAAIKLDYEKTMHEMSLASQTLTDVTLEMLSSSKSNEEEEKQTLQFSAVGEKFKDKVYEYVHPGVLSRSKLIPFLYLGLLITHDKAKLSDLLRWMWEEHVSYSYVFKFLPPEVKFVGDTATTFGPYIAPSSYHQTLSMAQNLGNFIGVKAVKSPSLKDLIKQYTTELNLPAQICLLAHRLLGLLPSPQESVPVSIKDKIPNWEGIAMAHIIIALKIVFGLDDFTENRNSKVARRINELITSQHESVKLFIWEDWIHFCTLRRTAFMLLHDRSSFESELPTSVVQNIKPVLSLWKKRYQKSNVARLTSKRQTLLKETHKNIVSRIQDKSPAVEYNENPIIFPPSLTPFSEYTEIIVRAGRNGQLSFASCGEWGSAVCGLNLDLLSENFTSTVVDYLTHPESYVEWARHHGLRVGLHNGSGVTSIKYPVTTITAKKTKMNWKEENLFFYRVKVFLDKVEGLPDPPKCQATKFTVQNRSYSCHKPIIYPKLQDRVTKGPLPTITEMKDCASGKPTKSSSKPIKGAGQVKFVKPTYEDLPQEDEDKMLHTPHTEYWMLHLTDEKLDALTVKRFSKHRNQLPASFLFLLEECSTLLEMEPALLYKEVTNLEVLHKDLSIASNETNAGVSVSTYNLETYGKESSISHLKATW